MHTSTMRFLISAAVLILALSACGDDNNSDDVGGAEDEPDAVTITGWVEVLADFAVRIPRPLVVGESPCISAYPNEDVAAGDEVVVRNAEGVIIGQAQLAGGVFVGEPGMRPLDSPCRYLFTVEDLPADSEFYEVSAAGQDKTVPKGERGEDVTFQLAEY